MDLVPLDLGRRCVPYAEAWQTQREVHAAVVDGRRTAAWDRPADGTPVVDVDRGGRITWHGPGQLVVYPIIRLAQPIDVVGYVRALEQAVIDTCTELGVPTGRVDGRSGVWLPADHRRERKVAAIGVRVARGVTMHGLAVNCDADLTAFAMIVPCGLPDADVTSLSSELGRRVSIAVVTPLLCRPGSPTPPAAACSATASPAATRRRRTWGAASPSGGRRRSCSAARWPAA